MTVIFLLLKLEEQFFSEYVYLFVNFILEISKVLGSAAVLGSCQPKNLRLAGKRQMDFMKL